MLLQGRHREFEPGKAQYSTPNFLDLLFLIRALEIKPCGLGSRIRGMEAEWRHN